jgi:ABC-2 type transport system permease protein
MNLQRTRAMFRKELKHILRDPRSLILALAQPLLLLLLFGWALSLDVDRIATLIYDADHSARSRELIERFKGSRFFEIEGFVDGYAAIEREIDRGRILMGIAIPSDYSRHIEAGDNAAVQILLDGSDSNTASIALSYATALVRSYSLELRSDTQNLRAGWSLNLPVDPRLRIWYNSTLESKNYVVPGLVAVILMLIAALLTSLTIAREWEMGTMEQLLSTPLRPAELLLGKMMAFFVVGVIDTLIAVLVAIFVFHVPFRGSLPLLAGTSCMFLFGSFSWGIFLSAITKSQLMAYQVGFVTSFLPSFLLSGFVWAIENMPRAIQLITYLVPARYFITILKGIFLKGVGLEALWVELAFLVAYAGIIFVAATLKLNQKLA